MNPIPSMDEQFIGKLTQVIDENLHDENFGAAELAEQLGISRVTLYRKVKSIVKKSVSEFIRETRLKRALELLKNKSGTVAEISYKVGFNNPSYFNKCFHDFFGATPGDVLKGIQVIDKEEPDVKSSVSKKQVKFIRFTVLLVLTVVLSIVIVYSFIPYSLFHHSDKKITIMVLPFKIENTDSKYYPYINQLKDGIIQELKFMDGIEVIPYKDSEDNNEHLNNGKLKTDYTVEGIARTLPGSTTTIFINLVNKKTGKIAGDALRERVLNLKGFDIKEMIDEAVISIKNELESYLFPEEEGKIKKNYTSNIEADLLYQKGLYFFELFQYENDFDLLYRSRSYFKQALAYDSTYVLPMEKLGRIILLNMKYENLSWEVFNRAMKYADDAIRINPDYTPAYCLKAKLVAMLPEKYGGGAQASLNLLEEALKIDPKNWEIYELLANNMGWRGKSNSDFAYLEYLIKAYRLNPDPRGDKFNVEQLAGILCGSGNVDAAYQVIEKVALQYPDSIRYFNLMQKAELIKKDLNSSIRYGLKALKNNPNDLTTLDYLASTYLLSRDYKNALIYYRRYFDVKNGNNPITTYFAGRGTSFGWEARFPMAYYAFALLKNNEKKEADRIFQIILDKRIKSVRIDSLRKIKGLRVISIVDLIELVQVYSAMGKTEKVMELFDFWNEKELGGWLNIWRDSPLMENIKNDPKILEYCKKVELNENNWKRKVKKILKREKFLKS